MYVFIVLALQRRIVLAIIVSITHPIRLFGNRNMVVINDSNGGGRSVDLINKHMIYYIIERVHVIRKLMKYVRTT